LVDPNVAPVRALSREERELMIAANNGYLLAFDNLSVSSVSQRPKAAHLVTFSDEAIRGVKIGRRYGVHPLGWTDVTGADCQLIFGACRKG
jgi:hypothetical protein